MLKAEYRPWKDHNKLSCTALFLLKILMVLCLVCDVVHSCICNRGKRLYLNQKTGAMGLAKRRCVLLCKLGTKRKQLISTLNIN